eukprot:549399-Prymnesium_polylepis.1
MTLEDTSSGGAGGGGSSGSAGSAGASGAAVSRIFGGSSAAGSGFFCVAVSSMVFWEDLTPRDS